MKKILVILGIIILFILTTYVGKKWYAQELKQAKINENILASNTEPQPIIIDTQKQTGTISPLLFGGAHSPLTNHLDAWDKVADAGVTFMRRDFFMEQIVPSNISLADYKANKNDIQNPKKWNPVLIQAAKERYQLAKDHGMQTMGIVDYSPPWLTYNGKSNGVPKDWAVFRDIVKKNYLLFRDDLDYLEVWNEPTFELFNDPKNSGLTMEQAYIQIAKNIIEVVRDVDEEKNDGKHIKLGGLVADNPDRTNMLRAILKDDYIRSNLDFVSYHIYAHPEPTAKKYTDILKEYNLENMPLFITEWNHDVNEREDSEYRTGNLAISYTADKLLSMMQQHIAGANYFMLAPVDFNIPGIGKTYMGFYRWVNNKAQLLPQAKTWRVLSKSLALGKGPNTMLQTSHDTSLKVVGFVNSQGQLGAAIVNTTNDPVIISTSFINTDRSHVKNIKVYYASADNDGSTPVVDLDIPAVDSNYKQSLLVPEQSLVGVILSDDVEWFNKLRYTILPN